MPDVQCSPPSDVVVNPVTNPPLLPSGKATVQAWEKEKTSVLARWTEYIGCAPWPYVAADVKTTADYSSADYDGRMLSLRTEPDYYEQCYLLVPKTNKHTRKPAVVIFYYDVDVPVGRNMGSPHWKENNEVRHWALHLVRRGYVVIVQRWAYEGFIADAPRTGARPLAERYAPAVRRQQRLFPGWTGMGRVVSDAKRVMDYLLTLDEVDPRRIACFGHSLGGKMAFYAAAFDPRYSAVVASDFGLGLGYSNWDAPWYLGPEIHEADFGKDHHQLLACIAPRPFLLIAGEDADGDRSWDYMESARQIYSLYGAACKLAMCNHRQGHTPTAEALRTAYDWLDKQLAMPGTGNGYAGGRHKCERLGQVMGVHCKFKPSWAAL